MLRRTTKIQLILFVIITLVGVTYVGTKYVGVTKGLFGSHACTVSADFPDSGGIFTSAEVTYRGVTVGKVGSLHLIKDGVRVDLNLDNCDSPKIPVTATAHVSDRSVVGEQYVNLIPPDNKCPCLTGHQILPMDKNTIPISPKQLLTNMDALVNSIDVNSLKVTIEELGKAFGNRGEDLGRLLDAQNNLLQAAAEALPQTLDLIQNSTSVLQTQLDESPALASFSHDLNLLSQTLKASDPDFRSLLNNGPADFQVLQSFLQNNRTDLGILFANLATTGEIITRYLPGLEEVFELYPALAAGAFTVLQHNVGRLGFVTNAGDPADCGSPSEARQGYDNTKVRPPSDTSPQAPNTTAYCSAGPNSPINVRGSANAPGGDPMSTGGGDVAYPRVTTGNTIRVGSTGGGPILGDQSWYEILTAGLVN